jgi:hypothetical protein
MTAEQVKFFFLGYLTAWAARGVTMCLRALWEMRSSKTGEHN